MNRMCRCAVAAGFCWMAAAGQVTAQSQIWGEVRNSVSGWPLGGVTVELVSGLVADNGRAVILDIGQQAPVSRVAFTNGGGSYGFVSLPAGTYEVSYTLPGFSTFVVETFSVPQSAVVRLDVQMATGALEETVTVRIRDGELQVAELPGRSRILGRAREHRTGALDGVDIRVLRRRMGWTWWFAEQREGRTDDDGRYDFDNLVPGDYLVEFSMPGVYTTVVDEIELGPNTVVEMDVAMFRGINDSISGERITFSPRDDRGYVETRVYPYDAVDAP